MSLFSTNLIFEDTNSNASEDSFDNDLYTHNIESDIINIIEEEPPAEPQSGHEMGEKTA